MAPGPSAAGSVAGRRVGRLRSTSTTSGNAPTDPSAMPLLRTQASEILEGGATAAGTSGNAYW